VRHKHRPPLTDRVVKAADAALIAQSSASAVDVLLGLGWLDPNSLRRWRQGQLDCLEAVLQIDPSRLAEAMKLFRTWAAANGLQASETPYVARTPQRQTLRFSRGGDPTVERQYATHWLSPTLSEARRERLTQKASRAPELVVINPLNSEWKCHRCAGTGDLLIMEKPGPACLSCAGLDDLEFLPAGDALVTRRVKARSTRYAVVVRFSRSRRRYERQGLLVEPQALKTVQSAIADERGR